jgi:hypothetical protein
VRLQLNLQQFTKAVAADIARRYAENERANERANERV